MACRCRRGAEQPSPLRDVDGAYRSCQTPGGDQFLEILLSAFVLINLITARDEYFLPVIFSRSSATATLTLGVTQAAVNPQYQSVAWGNEAAMGLVVIVPDFALAMIFQKQIIEGLMAGALKG
jgi:ABC-type glycerol-3-phosphate transport system permease component